jgi:hypothetical protein
MAGVARGLHSAGAPGHIGRSASVAAGTGRNVMLICRRRDLSQQLAGALDRPRLDPHGVVHQRVIVSLPTCPRFCLIPSQFPNGGA